MELQGESGSFSKRRQLLQKPLSFKTKLPPLSPRIHPEKALDDPNLTDLEDQAAAAIYRRTARTTTGDVASECGTPEADSPLEARAERGVT